MKVVPRKCSGEVDWTRILIAALGIGAMVAGGLLADTSAGVALVGAGGALAGWAARSRTPEQG